MLTADEQRQLDELIRRASEEDEDFLVEIRKGERACLLPFRHARQWIEREFGISDAEPPSGKAAPRPRVTPDGEPSGEVRQDSGTERKISERYFGKRDE